MITINWEVNVETGSETASWEDLQVESQEHWDSLSEPERESRIDEFLIELPERVFICRDSYS